MITAFIITYAVLTAMVFTIMPPAAFIPALIALVFIPTMFQEEG